MNGIENIFWQYIRNYWDVMIRDLTLSVFIITIIFSSLTFLISYIVYKYHHRIKTKFAAYTLNNSWISLLAENMILSVELSEYVANTKLETNNSYLLIDIPFSSKIKYKFALLLRTLTNYLDIVECKYYFKYW